MNKNMQGRDPNLENSGYLLTQDQGAFIRGTFTRNRTRGSSQMSDSFEAKPGFLDSEAKPLSGIKQSVFWKK